VLEKTESVSTLCALPCSSGAAEHFECDHGANLLLECAARAKVERYHDGYASLKRTAPTDVALLSTDAFFPCALSMSGRIQIHGEFVCVICIPARRNTFHYFTTLRIWG
jgi:hypothetical protein